MARSLQLRFPAGIGLVKLADAVIGATGRRPVARAEGGLRGRAGVPLRRSRSHPKYLHKKSLTYIAIMR